MFNCLHNLAPSYVMNICQPVIRNLYRRRLCSAARGDLIVPPTRTVRYGPRSFAVAGPSTWNALPTPFRNGELSAMSSRRQQKTELYMRAYFHISTFVTVFTVRLGEHNFYVKIIIIIINLVTSRTSYLPNSHFGIVQVCWRIKCWWTPA